MQHLAHAGKYIAINESFSLGPCQTILLLLVSMIVDLYRDVQVFAVLLPVAIVKS